VCLNKSTPNNADSGCRLSTILFIILIWLYPLLPIGCAIRAWWLYRYGKVRGAVITTSSPLAVVLSLAFYGASVLHPGADQVDRGSEE
jgi:hypothetical protein